MFVLAQQGLSAVSTDFRRVGRASPFIGKEVWKLNRRPISPNPPSYKSRVSKQSKNHSFHFSSSPITTTEKKEIC